MVQRISASRLSFLVLALFFFLGEAVLSAAPAGSRPPASGAKKKWTIILFMAADNNLEAGTEADLNELETVGSTDQINVVAQVDRNGKFSQGSDWKWSGTKRFLIQKDTQPKKITSPVIDDIGEVDMADPQVLLDFVKWCKDRYPAERYALILWNHGTGWKEISPDAAASVMDYGTSGLDFEPGALPGMDTISYNISYDDTSGTSMDIPNLGQTLTQAAEILGQPFDLLGFDACLMQMVEVAHACAGSARFQVGSPDLEPERGWAYDSILAGLAAAPQMDGRQLGDLIVQTYKNSYSMGSQGNVSVILSLIDLSKAAEFTARLNEFAELAIRNIADIDLMEQGREASLKYVYKDYLDLGHFLEVLQARNPNAALKKSARDLLNTLIGTPSQGGLVIRCGQTGDKYKDGQGVAIFFPDRAGFRTYKKRYKLLPMSTQCGWYNFLQELEKPSLPYVKIQEVLLEDQNKDGRIAAGESVKVRLNLRHFGKKIADKLQVTCVTTSTLLNAKKFDATVSGPPPGKDGIVPAFDFTVSPDAPTNSEVSLTFSLSGPGVPVSTARITFYVKAPFATQGKVLLVMTDGFSPASPVLQAMFQSNKIKFDVWDRMLDGDIKLEVLKRYIDGWVFIAAQDSSDQQQLTPTEIQAMAGFLKTGGRLVLSGQDLAFSFRDTAFLRDQARLVFVQDDINVHVVSGQNGFAQNGTFQIFGGDGANNQKWPDEIDALSGATLVMKFNEGARDMANDKDMIGPNLKPSALSRGIKSSGGAAATVVDGYRLMFFAFGIEAVNAPTHRDAIMKAIIAFMTPTVDGQIRDLAGASSRRRPTARTSRQNLDSLDLLSNIERNITLRVKRQMERDPYAADRVLQSIEQLPTPDREAVQPLEKNIRSLLEFQRQHGTLSPR